MRLLVTGGRDYPNYQRVWAVLDDLHERHNIMLLIEGGAKGVDTFARVWAKDRNVMSTTVPADWEKHGRAAGMIRNKYMLNLEPDLVAAFPGGKGTANMIKVARNAGVKVNEYKP